MEDLKQIQEFFSKPLNEVSGNIDIEDFTKVVQAITQSKYPATVMLSPMFGKNEIEIIVGMDAPDPIIVGISNIMDDLGYKSGRDYSIAGDSSTLSRREYSDIRRVNGGHKDYFEEAKIEVDDKTEFKLDLKHLLDKHVVEQGYSLTKEHETDPDMELKVGDYQTQHFHMCPGAKSLYQDIEDKVEDMGLAIRSAKLQDALFAMEESALENGANEADVFAAETIADQIMAMAAMMGLDKEHSYIQGHVDKIKGAVDKNQVAEASKGALNYFNDLKYYYQKAFRYLDVEEREEYKQLAKDFFSRLQIDDKVRPVGLEESSSSEEKRIAKRAIKSIAKYRGVSEDEARNDLIRAAKELGSLKENMSLDDQAKAYYLAKIKSGEIDTLPEDPKAAFLAQMMKDQIDHDKETLRKERGLEETAAYIAETIKLGMMVNEELCDKGKRYIKARQAAGEKSSAYLSGRAVRVCKGQIEWPKKGKKKK